MPTIRSGMPLPSMSAKVTAEPTLEALRANPDAVRSALRFPGWQASVPMVSDDGRIRAVWRAVLRDGANYVRQFVTLKALRGEIPIKNIRLVDLPAPGASVAGTVAGSPVVEGNMFFAYEHPNARSEVVDAEPEGESNPPMKQIQCSLDRDRPLEPGRPLAQSSVIGVAPAGLFGGIG